MTYLKFWVGSADCFKLLVKTWLLQIQLHRQQLHLPDILNSYTDQLSLPFTPACIDEYKFDEKTAKCNNVAAVSKERGMIIKMDDTAFEVGKKEISKFYWSNFKKSEG